ncbi:MAG: 4-alpha-glucanotransferase [Myxococcota bacterium]
MDLTQLHLEAQEAGIQLGFHSPTGDWKPADPEALNAVLTALGPRPQTPMASQPHIGEAWRPVRRDWGAFLPHHALRTAATRGLGDYTALGDLGAWLGGLGASLLGTLPMLPTFLDRAGPFEPSPYAPVSRHHWAEHLIDPVATPEWTRCPQAQQILKDADADGTLSALRSGDYADPAAAWDLQWRLLMALSKVAWADPDAAARMEEDPSIAVYARFRAASITRGPWPTWASAQRWSEPHLGLGGEDLDPEHVRAWTYAQHEARRQVMQLRARLKAAGVDLYLDLPIGTHPDGFDTWHGTGTGPLHAAQMSTGAPPDPYFPSGQDWGFPPVHPNLSAEQNHADLRGALHHHATAAHRLRIDHILGLHRLFWIPSQMGPERGVYVENPADAWWRHLVSASHDTRCEMVGEDLGMLPESLHARMHQHNLSGLYVGQFTARPDPSNPLPAPRQRCIASLNTHDTPTFAGWCDGLDLADHHALGWMTAEALASAKEHRRRTVQALTPLAQGWTVLGPDASDDPAVHLHAALALKLAQSPASTVLINLEDLWGETRPQNVPGTWRERPNWTRRSRLDLAQMKQHRAVLALATALSQERAS